MILKHFDIKSRGILFSNSAVTNLISCFSEMNASEDFVLEAHLDKDDYLEFYEPVQTVSSLGEVPSYPEGPPSAGANQHIHGNIPCLEYSRPIERNLSKDGFISSSLGEPQILARPITPVQHMRGILSPPSPINFSEENYLPQYKCAVCENMFSTFIVYSEHMMYHRNQDLEAEETAQGEKESPDENENDMEITFVEEIKTTENNCEIEILPSEEKMEITEERKDPLTKYFMVRNYFIRKLKHQGESFVPELRRQITFKRGSLEMGTLWGPPIPPKKTRKAWFQKMSELRINFTLSPLLFTFLKKFSKTVYTFFSEDRRGVLNSLSKINAKDINESNHKILSSIYAAYHTLIPEDVKAYLPIEPKFFNYRHWKQYNEIIVEKASCKSDLVKKEDFLVERRLDNIKKGRTAVELRKENQKLKLEKRALLEQRRKLIETRSNAGLAEQDLGPA